MFTNVINSLPPEDVMSIHVDPLDFDGEFAYLLGSSCSMVPMATDTLCVREGEIIMHSIAVVFGS
ncbi:MAG: hypothetical protein ABI835_06400 [Chloroflexota bacterium]